MARGVRLIVELGGCGLFVIAQGDGSRRPPAAIFRELSCLPKAKLSESNISWRWHFPIEAYSAVIERIRTGPLSACILDELPDWVVAAVLEAQQRSSAMAAEAEDRLQSHMRSLPAEVQAERPVMPFQKEGIRFGLSRGGRCLLADEMGLGKTVQALSITAQYTDEWPMLVVAPSTLRLVWRDQALTWLPHIVQAESIQVLLCGKGKVRPEARVVIVSYDLLTRNELFENRADRQPYKVVIVDESHYIKDPASKRSKVVLRVCQAAQRCVLISGTPALNRAAEICTQLQALLPAAVVPTYTTFCQRYCERQDRHYKRGSVVQWAGAIRKEELNALLLDTVMIRRRKIEVLSQLPSKRRREITLDASRLDKVKMKELQHLQGTVPFSKIANAGEASKGENGLGAAPQIMACFKLTAEAKVEAVLEYLDHLLGHVEKLLVFGHHYVVLDGIEKKLVSGGIGHIRIDGKTLQARRNDLVEQFQNDSSIRVAVLSICACGQGLTLTAAHTVVFAELYWVPGQLQQAEDRVHRIGQEQPVDIHYCIAEGTLDGRVFNALNRKCMDTTGVLDGVERNMDVRHKSSQASASAMSAADSTVGTANERKAPHRMLFKESPEMDRTAIAANPVKAEDDAAAEAGTATACSSSATSPKHTSSDNWQASMMKRLRRSQP
eukprot:TRINITY_DN50082_c0_g1_i1.p1 TRINITY_DN50082_c0_g1~~TRINITY_DN50082_c0_g1_i1.p1  ORF type:complete len:744 (-),score=119.89 TRINITY_DN50082_c0_g1_i1:433-2433(-)